MTSQVAVVGLTWDGYDVQRSDLNVFLEISEGLDELPDLRTFHQVIPFRHGRRADRPMADRRVLVLTGMISGPSAGQRAAYRGYVDEVKQAFTPFRDPAILTATLEDGTTRWIRAMPIDSRFRPIVPGAANTSVELIADDPFWYSAYGNATMDSGLLMDDGHFMDSGGEIVVVPLSGSHSLSFDTVGTAEVERIRVRMIGPSVSAPGIEVDTPDGIVGFVMASALASGETLEVDAYLRTVTINGVTARSAMTLKAANLHGEYLRLPVGIATARVLGAPTEARLFFTPTWL